MTYSHVAAVPWVQLLGASEAVSVLRRGKRRNLLRFLLKKAAIYTFVQVKAKIAGTLYNTLNYLQSSIIEGTLCKLLFEM